MRITFDLSPAVHHHAGMGRYARELLTALLEVDTTNSYDVVYYAPAGSEQPDPPLDRLPARRLRLSARPWRLSVLMAEYAGVPLDRWLKPGDVFHATDNWLPPLRRAGTVLSLQDLTHLLFPEYHLPLNRWFLKLMLPRFLRRADAVIVASESTRRDAERLLQIPAEKMQVIYLGVNKSYHPIADLTVLARVRARYRLPDAYVLYFGTIEPRKNLQTVLDAYHALLAQADPVPDLVIAGRKGWRFQPVFDQVRALGLETRVHFTDWVAEADAPAVMNAARAFVYPSLYEGFGLPPLEAMACGVPILCSNASSLPEVVGQAGLLLPPDNAGAWAEALSRVLSDAGLSRDLRARGLSRAGQFTWELTARQTVAVYQRVTDARRAIKPVAQ
jgi:glycosyltransferase involved in cell wall biosynthesis